jgi:hypothetical protein
MTSIYPKNKGKETLNCIVLAKNVKYTISQISFSDHLY